eukprot:EG_transcript_45334
MRAHLGLVFLVTWMSLIMLLLLFANSAIGGLRTQLTALDARVDAILRSQTQLQASFAARPPKGGFTSPSRGAMQSTVEPGGGGRDEVNSMALPSSSLREADRTAELKEHFRSWDGGTEVFKHVLVNHARGRREHSL